MAATPAKTPDKAVETEAPPATAGQVLDSLKAARKAIEKLQEKEAALRKDFRDQQLELKAVLERATKTKGIEVLVSNALSSGLVDTTDPTTFQAVSEPFVVQLAARAHL